MNPFEFVLMVLIITGVFSIVRHRRGLPAHPFGRRWNNSVGTPVETHETMRLRDEVRDLKERIKVLERIAVDKENSLAKEIESLRDR